MITADAASDALIRRLEGHAKRIALQYAGQRRPNPQAGAIVDWHSAQSLWPNFTKG